MKNLNKEIKNDVKSICEKYAINWDNLNKEKKNLLYHLVPKLLHWRTEKVIWHKIEPEKRENNKHFPKWLTLCGENWYDSKFSETWDLVDCEKCLKKRLD